MSETVSRLNEVLSARYHLERKLGEGGMATVYLAEDLRHERKVAIKVLKPELAAVIGAKRFLTEIKTTANLQHPHILPLFDSGDADGFLFYVMPFAGDESLRDRLRRSRQLPVDEAVSIARGIASALDYAHREGVVHRDIKPENILLNDGQPLVTDFGIALALSGTERRLTETGMSVGTPQYMSPEQVTDDRAVGPSTDVYALGCVLYEMLAGEPPHVGGTAQAILAKLLSERPTPIRRLRDTVPPNVDEAVLTALERTPADRFRSAAAFADALADPAYTRSTPQTPRSSASVGPSRRLSWGIAAVTTAMALWGWLRPVGEGPPPGVLRYSTRLPWGSAELDQFYSNFVLSPDGRNLVYVREGRLWVQTRDDLQGTGTPLAGTEGAWNPFFSPDGRRVGFLHPTTGSLRVISLDGGPATTVAEGVGRAGASWGPDDVIYVSMADDSMGIASVPASGGELAPVTILDDSRGEIGHWEPQVLPGGDAILFTALTVEGPAQAEITVVDLASGETHSLAHGLGGRYARSGHVLYVTSTGTLMAAPFDRRALVLTDNPQAIVDGVMLGRRALDLQLSDTGTLMFTASDQLRNAIGEPVWVSRDGRVEPVDPGWIGHFLAPALSPDGTRLAVGIRADADEHIWIKQMDRGPLERLTLVAGPNYRPAWTPDGDSVAFVSVRGDDRHVFVGAADGGSEPRLFLEGAPAINEVSFSPAGDWVVIRTGSGSTGQERDLYAVPLSDRGDPVPLVATESAETSPSVSPDGRWMVYVSDRTGQSEVYVRPFPRTRATRWQVSLDGGTEPLWSRNGRELFYRTADSLIAVHLAPDTTFSILSREALFSMRGFAPPYTQHTMYDVGPDDRRFIMIRPLDGTVDAALELVVIENFFEVLRRRFPR